LGLVRAEGIDHNWPTLRADDRQADDVGIVPRDLSDGLRERKLADFPFAIEGEACEYLVMAARLFRFSSFYDIEAPPTNVRFTPKSGH
jgi:hypothetical protein